MDAPPILLTILACGALLVRVGLGWYVSGICRAKNAAGAVLRNIIDLAVAVIAFWAVGMAVLGGNWAIIGQQRGEVYERVFALMVFVLIGAAPVTGAIAERCKFFPMLLAPALLGGVVIPIAARWIWNTNGWLAKFGVIDVAGASALHVVGGLAAGSAAIIAGARSGKYNRDGSSNLIPGHSVPMASVGVMLMLAGWLPYMLAASLMHSAAELVAINVLLAASAGAIVAVIVSHIRYGKPDIMLTYSGLLGGLVSITAAGGLISPLAAVITGAIAGVIVPTATVVLDMLWHIDDPAGGIAIHAVGGAWAMIAMGIFKPVETWGEKFRFLGVQIVGLLAIAALAIVLSSILFLVLKMTIGLRLHEDAEYDGADLAEHDVNAYPDFSQSMIKSYHLRQV